MPEEKKIEKEVVVVQELPQQAVREALSEDGKDYSLMTITEALSELINNVRIIKKAVA